MVGLICELDDLLMKSYTIWLSTMLIMAIKHIQSCTKVNYIKYSDKKG